MGLLDITPKMTKINEYTQTEFEEHLFRLGFRTQYGLNYWFVDVPCTFENFLKLDVRISISFHQHNDAVKIRLAPMHLQRGFKRTFKWSNSESIVWHDISICHSPEEMEIEYLESLNTLMSEETAKSWFVKRVLDRYIDFPDRTSFLSRYKTL